MEYTINRRGDFPEKLSVFYVYSIMKLSGMAGTGSGKLGSMVYATVAGQQIVRQHQPVVTNPNTTAQVQQRAKLKLMSQVAKAMAPVIAIPKDGLVSKRNGFIKTNFSLATINSAGNASVDLNSIQLTNGYGGNIAITSAITSGYTIISLSELPASNVSRIVLLAFRRMTDGTLSYLESTLVEKPSDGWDVNVQLAQFDGHSSYDCVYYAYGMVDVDAAATAKFNNYQVNSAVTLATLVANRTIKEDEYSFTATTSRVQLASA